MRARIVRALKWVWTAMNVPLCPRVTCWHSWKIIRVEDCGERYCYAVTARCRRCGTSAKWESQ